MPFSSRFRRSLVGVVLSVSVATGCAENIHTRGNDPNPDMLAMLKPGEQSRMDVEALLGSPSNTATFDNETWYYISSTFKQVAFFAPEEVSRKVIAVSFTQDGYVKEVASFGLQDGKVVEISKRETPTAGNEIGLLEQLMGNLGKFQ
ncbi:MAG: hypothetical protein A2516_11600 [Alphaproteobacteria bacterium RIFOXYD12_FULL_60_8]|nr:MAG: hypothetical protein A2516_11600 [Alphaproteobacteria bacterium RIFOXYD12_FULL_60_8]